MLKKKSCMYTYPYTSTYMEIGRKAKKLLLMVTSRSEARRLSERLIFVVSLSFWAFEFYFTTPSFIDIVTVMLR